jgi:acetate kinase
VRVLVVNAGSTGLKLRLLDGHDTLEHSVDLPGGVERRAIDDAIADWPAPDAVGHRIVHGGHDFAGPVRITETIRRQLEDLVDLAPLHQPASLAALDAVTAALPDVVAVACFDTAFHATIPDEAATYAIPTEWRERYGIRRFGFHGLSHAYCAGRAAQVAGRQLDRSRIVTCHLGGGASLAAVRDGRSVDTTMGFTPLDGLVMATRSGSLDPGLVLWLEEHEHLTPHEVGVALESRSGLLALAGTADMREIVAAGRRGIPTAELALAVYTHRLVGGIAAMAAALGGLEILAFTGGVGEHSAEVRKRATDRLAFLGVGIDRELNRTGAGDAEITSDGHPVRTVVITAREDLQIAGETRRVVGAAP